MALAARMAMSELNTKWWNDACAVVEARQEFDCGLLSEYENTFANNIWDLIRLSNGQFRPTVKQFNFMRELARKLS